MWTYWSPCVLLVTIQILQWSWRQDSSSSNNTVAYDLSTPAFYLKSKVQGSNRCACTLNSIVHRSQMWEQTTYPAPVNGKQHSKYIQWNITLPYRDQEIPTHATLCWDLRTLHQWKKASQNKQKLHQKHQNTDTCGTPIQGSHICHIQ